MRWFETGTIWCVFFIQFPAVIPDDFANLGGLAQCLSHMEL